MAARRGTCGRSAGTVDAPSRRLATGGRRRRRRSPGPRPSIAPVRASSTRQRDVRRGGGERRARKARGRAPESGSGDRRPEPGTLFRALRWPRRGRLGGGFERATHPRRLRCVSASGHRGLPTRFLPSGRTLLPPVEFRLASKPPHRDGDQLARWRNQENSLVGEASRHWLWRTCRSRRLSRAVRSPGSSRGSLSRCSGCERTRGASSRRPAGSRNLPFRGSGCGARRDPKGPGAGSTELNAGIRWFPEAPRPEAEADILFVHGGNLCIVSCKNGWNDEGVFAHLRELRALVAEMGEGFVRPTLVSTRTLTDREESRARSYEIGAFSGPPLLAALKTDLDEQAGTFLKALRGRGRGAPGPGRR